MEIQKRIDEIDQILAQPYDAGSQAAVDQRNVLTNERAELVEKLKAEQEWLAQHQAEKAEREQKTAETIDSYVDTVAQIWDALFPTDPFEQLLGKNDYAEKRQDFYKLNHLYFAEKVAKINADHEDEIAAKDEKYRLLTKQALETENQLAEARRENQTLSDQLWQAGEEIKERDHRLENLNERMQEIIKERDEALQKNGELHGRIAELESKLEEATKPKSAEKPSENLQIMLEQVKSKNEAKKHLLNVRPIAGNWVEGINPETGKKEVVHTSELAELQPPEVEAAGENSFRGENPSVESQNSGISAPESEGMSAPSAFPEAAESSMDGSGNTGLASDVQYDVRAEIEALKRRVERIERHANLPGVA